MHLVTAAVLALGASSRAPLPQDTILDARRGETLIVQNLEGRVLVESWDQDAVEVIVESGSEAVGIRRARGAIEVRARHPRGREGEGSYRIRVPAWMPVEITGVNLSISAEALEGGLQARTVEGSVHVRGGRGPVRARAVDGVVEVRDVVGDVVASSADDDVIVRGVRGSVKAENVDGDIRMRDVQGDRVEAETVDGDVAFEGTLRPQGEYRLLTHDGDLTVQISGSPDVRVTVSTHDGEFRSDFPVTLDRLRGGQEFSFTLGRGSATLHLEAFDGDIRVSRR